MIRPLRRRHVGTFGVLAVLLPLLFLASLAARRTVPPMEALPAGLEWEAASRWSQAQEDAVLGQALGLRIGFLAAEAEGEGRLFLAELPADENPPDLLLYWSRAAGVAEEALPEGAKLLGALVGASRGVFRLPPEGAAGEGHLLTYSLALQAVSASASLGGLD